jgi:hypothetical protein
MAGPPFPSQIVQISQFWLYLPYHSTVLGAENCVVLLDFFLTCKDVRQEMFDQWSFCHRQTREPMRHMTTALRYMTRIQANKAGKV